MNSADIYKGYIYEVIERFYKNHPENPSLGVLIAGIGPYYIDAPDGMGGTEHAIWTVLDVIYEFYTNNPELNMQDNLYISISNIFNGVEMLSDFRNGMRCLQYQITNQKQNISPFTIDTDTLIDICEKQLPRIKQIYEKAPDYDEICADLDSMLDYMKRGLAPK